jgi:hypothetical protein
MSPEGLNPRIPLLDSRRAQMLSLLTGCYTGSINITLLQLALLLYISPRQQLLRLTVLLVAARRETKTFSSSTFGVKSRGAGARAVISRMKFELNVLRSLLLRLHGYSEFSPGSVGHTRGVSWAQKGGVAVTTWTVNERVCVVYWYSIQ